VIIEILFVVALAVRCLPMLRLAPWGGGPNCPRRPFLNSSNPRIA
jgi:hypothetical protein